MQQNKDNEELRFKTWLEQFKQESNDRATVMATSIETQAIENQKFLAAFNAEQQAFRDAEVAKAQAERDRQKAETDVRFALLQAALAGVSAQVQPAQPEEGAQPASQAGAGLTPAQRQALAAEEADPDAWLLWVWPVGLVLGLAASALYPWGAA